MKRSDTWMPFYVGDYLGDTMAFSTVQHGAYLLLLLACWKSGGSLPADDDTLANVTRLPKEEWVRHKQLLLSCFQVASGSISHKRVLIELERAKRLTEARSEAGKKGGRPKKVQEETNSFPDALANGKQNETPSPSPIPSSLRSEGEGADAPPAPKPKRQSPKPQLLECPTGVDPQVWADWLDLRKGKKAPVTPTVIESAMREAAKARISFEDFLRIWCLRGSQGLQADWLKPNEVAGAQRKSFRERDQELAEDLVRAMTPSLAPARREPQRDFIDMPTNLPKFLEN